MNPTPPFDINPLLLLGVGLALGLSLAAIALSLTRLRGTVLERRPRWPQARWIVMPVFGSAVLAIGMVWLMYQPEYEATAVLRISPSPQTILFKNTRDELPSYQVFVNTEVAVMAGPEVANRVLDQADVLATQWYRDIMRQTVQTGKGGVNEKFEEALAVEPRRGTELIDISFSAPKPAEAQLVANAVVKQYKDLRYGEDKKSDSTVREILTSEQTNLQMEIDGLIKTRFNISGRLGTDAPEQLRSMLSQRMNLLEDQIHEKNNLRELRNWELAYLQRAMSQPASAPSGAPSEQELKIAGTGSPAAGSSQTQTIAQINMHLERLAHEIELLEKDLKAQRAKVADAGDVAQDIASYDERIRQKKELYEAVRQRREQLEMEDKAPARVRIVANAMEPIHPRNDRRPGATLAILAAAACLSLLLLAVRPSDGTRSKGSTLQP